MGNLFQRECRYIDCNEKETKCCNQHRCQMSECKSLVMHNKKACSEHYPEYKSIQGDTW